MGFAVLGIIVFDGNGVPIRCGAINVPIGNNGKAAISLVEAADEVRRFMIESKAIRSGQPFEVSATLYGSSGFNT